jgi:hypothetical protein
MRRTPLYSDPSGLEVSLGGRKGELLRLLLLMEGKPMSKHDIAWHMLSQRGRSGPPRPVATTTIEGYVGQLRDVVGHGAIVTVGDGYQTTVEPDDVDAYVFAGRIDALGVTETWSVEEASDELIDRLDVLLQLRSMWQANPARDYYQSELLEICETYQTFEHHYLRLRFAIVYVYLRRATPPDIAAAITYLQAMAEHGREDTETEVWELLLRAQGSVASYQRDLPGVWKKIQTHFDSEIPSALIDIHERVVARDPSSLFGVKPPTPSGESPDPRHGDTRNDSGDSASSALVEIAREIGLSVEGSSLRLQGSRAEPIECIEQTVRTLYFEGILASKWVEASVVRSRFDALLSRLDDEGGDVRFLLIDPESDSYERFRDLRQGNEGLSSLRYLLRLVESHPSFQVRLYDALPAFRIVIIDHDVMTVSPYLLGAEDYLRGRYGWDAPHAAFDPFAPWSFAKAFEVMFLEQWRTARPIEELNIQGGE